MPTSDSSESDLKEARASTENAGLTIASVNERLSHLSMSLFVELQSLKNDLNDAKAMLTSDGKPTRPAVRSGVIEESSVGISLEADPPGVSPSVICRDPAMLDIVRFVEKIAPSNATVLITGESGSGKEVLARHLHSKSKRVNGAFIAVNCAAIPEGLLESELFGHEMGAFTDAVGRRLGKFELAHRGTLFLDEISEMSPALQAKLLRAAQHSEIDRVGGEHPIKVDVRFVAASNRNIEEEVHNGRFREDLYYRLNVVRIDVPPLRERPRDIELLVNHFVEAYGASCHPKAPTLRYDAWKAVLGYRWPGNVRELENCVHRAVLLAEDGVITPELILPSHVSLIGDNGSTAADRSDLADLPLADANREIILRTLRRCQGNRVRAASQLGISVRTLRNKLKLYRKSGPIERLSQEPGGGSNGIEHRLPGLDHDRATEPAISEDAIKQAEIVISLARLNAKRKVC